MIFSTTQMAKNFVRLYKLCYGGIFNKDRQPCKIKNIDFSFLILEYEILNCPLSTRELCDLPYIKESMELSGKRTINNQGIRISLSD